MKKRWEPGRHPVFCLGALGIALALGACQASGNDRANTGADADADTDTDADADADADADGDTDSEPDAGDTDTATDCNDNVESYIWIANTAEGTLSKVDTVCAIEVARYRTGPNGPLNDPSRTSVNRHGDMVVTNRSPMNNPVSGHSSVTKFAANAGDCIDRNQNGTIETSTGPADVRPWGEDECMLWNTQVGPPFGARATAWDGRENPKTGEGGHVWVGTCSWGTEANKVYKLDGDTGEILQEKVIPGACAYGGAVDGRGGFWIVINFAPDTIVRVDEATLETEVHPDGMCGYGLAIDSNGGIWTGGDLCIRRFEPKDATVKTVNVGGANCPGCTMLRGIAVGRGRSLGYVWASDSSGNLVKVNEVTGEFVESFPVGTPDMIGVAVDFEGYVWTVSQGGNAAYKVDPDTSTFTIVPIGAGPYTYSDMTGVQLENVIAPQ